MASLPTLLPTLLPTSSPNVAATSITTPEKTNAKVGVAAQSVFQETPVVPITIAKVSEPVTKTITTANGKKYEVTVSLPNITQEEKDKFFDLFQKTVLDQLATKNFNTNRGEEFDVKLEENKWTATKKDSAPQNTTPSSSAKSTQSEEPHIHNLNKEKNQTDIFYPLLYKALTDPETFKNDLFLKESKKIEQEIDEAELAKLNEELALEKKLDPVQPRGLKNLGNTCYLNAMFQAIYAVKDEMKISQTTETGKTLQQLITHYENKETQDPISLFELREQLNFVDGTQNDASECFTKLHAQNAFDDTIRVRTQTKETDRTEPWHPHITLQHPINCQNLKNLQNLIDIYFAFETSTGGQVSYLEAPDVVSIHLPRCVKENGRNMKDKTKITVLPEISIPIITAGKEIMTKYELVSATMHHGDEATSGHYTAFTLSAGQNKCYQCNDTEIKEINKEKILNDLSTDGTVFFYRKIKTSPATPLPT